MADKRADLDAKLALLEFEMKSREHDLKILEMNHKAAFEREKHEATMRQNAMGMVATAQSHDAKMEQTSQAHETKMEQAKTKEKT